MSETLHSLIPEYLQEQLSETDKQALRQRAATDPAFSAELDFQKKAAQAVRDAEYLRLKKMLRDEDALLKKSEKHAGATGRTVHLNSWKRYAAAAAMIAVCFSGWWLFVRETPQKMFAAAFTPYENVLSDEYGGPTERETVKLINDVEQAFLDLKDKKYPLAAASFERLVGTKNDPRFKFWQAQALAADDKADVAIPLLENFTADPKSTFYGAAHWYLALAYLQAGDAANAKNWLEKLVADPLIFERKKEAAELLGKLK